MTRRILQLLAAGGVVLLSPAAFAQTAPEDPQPTYPPADPEPTPMTEDTTPEAPPPDVDADVDVDVDVEPQPQTVTPPPPPPATTDPSMTGDPTYMQSRQYETTTEVEEPLLTRWGIGLSAGGGVSGFTDETARETTDVGGGWDVRATIGTNLPIAAEVSYIGSAQAIDAIGLDTDAILVGNGVQGNVRLNLLYETPVKPFLFVGAAWRHYSIANESFNTSAISDDDDVLEFPVGAGIAFTYRGFLLDARGEYRATTNEDLMPSLAGDVGRDEAELHRWGVNANIGVAF